jgi:hypothetical protein
MKYSKYIIIFLIIHSFLLKGCAQNHNNEDARKKYSEDLNVVINQLKLKDEIDTSLLEQVIPITKQEFIKFYSYFENKETRGAFEKMDNKIGNNAYKQVSHFFNLYIEMAEFIDSESVGEEYLTNYYYDLDFILEKNADAFCNLYKDLDVKKKNNLKDFFEDYCE